MPRGGKRKGAGRKSAWNTGKTKAVKLPESLIPEIVEFARTIDSTLVDGSYGQEKVEGKDRLVDILFDELDDRKAVHEIGYGLQLGINTRVGPVIVSANSTLGSPKLRLFWGFGFRLQ